MISTKKYQGKCWWCGKNTDSKEHKYKKSDIVREFGKGAYQNSVIRVTNEMTGPSEKNIQGPNSTQLQFPHVLCSDCNNNRSSAFDRSYDIFIDFLKLNEDKIYNTQTLDLFDIFGDNWRVEADNVIKYLIKHISCRLAKNEIEIKQGIVDFLNGGIEPTCLQLNLKIRSNIAYFVQMLKNNNEEDGYISISPLSGTFFIDSQEWGYLSSSYNYRGFSFSYFYDHSIGRFDSNLSKRVVDMEVLINQNYETKKH